ncbi:DUF4382 domain-containing protein [Winogradskyella undariae]|uniref:DUF4382 domain-containing protein n=1 Tax=Winogradskyella undariae TaxID=1285465 RepID=UPI00156ABC63|nr:DUF4382 domain-containing protein [Winogradskyella undariae]NRR91240.1 DUF4382 domain-containing protein [Winogradskyella undariae]
MKHLHLTKLFAFAFIILLSITSCSQDELSDGELSGITVSLKTTSNDTNAVFLEIEDVQVRIGKDASLASSWTSLETINSGIHNVSDLNGDLELMLVNQSEMSSTYIYEIRLVLGDNNFLNMNETLVSLDVTGEGCKTPSNIIETEFNANHFYNVIINLDLDESVSFDENESMMTFKPKSYTEIRQIEY